MRFDMDSDEALERYLNEHWETILDDLATLVRIPSFDESDRSSEGAPYGPGPRAALDAVIAIADRLELETHDCEGYLAFADWPGERETQLGIICHVDVVPAGPGWTFEAFELTEHEGYLVGRGTSDDKGPLVIALHALAFWKQHGARFPYTIRFLFGANEEVGMRDVVYYREHFDDPAFVFTPDAEFPVCYGEKGIYQGFAEKRIGNDRAIAAIEGGEAVNAVPGEAHARFIDPAQGELSAYGRTAHASTPELGENAIGLLARDILSHGIACDGERSFLQFVERLCASTDGSAFGIACEDADFGPLTICGGMIRGRDGLLSQSIDIRYPTTIDAERLTDVLEDALAQYGIEWRIENVKEPFVINAESPAVQALCTAYERSTGRAAKPFTMGGGTYAREFPHAASFGMESPESAHPDWVGGMHAPDEAISIAEYRAAFKIYVRAIAALMECDITI